MTRLISSSLNISLSWCAFEIQACLHVYSYSPTLFQEVIRTSSLSRVFSTENIWRALWGIPEQRYKPGWKFEVSSSLRNIETFSLRRSVLLAGSPIPSMLIISRRWVRLTNPVDIGSWSIPGSVLVLKTCYLRFILTKLKPFLLYQYLLVSGDERWRRQGLGSSCQGERGSSW